MPIQILSTFVRKGVGNYPLVDDYDIKGGFRVLATTLERDNILANLRKEGMHVYCSDVDTTYRLSTDLTTWVEASTGGSSGSVGSYDCPSSVAVLDVVYLSGSDEVDKADADGMGTQPVVGFVQQKMTSTTAKVQYSGELSGFSGLVAGATYYLSQTPGVIANTAPSDSGAIVQRVGVAKNATTLVVMIDRDYTIL
jgi:hypothetical protein